MRKLYLCLVLFFLVFLVGWQIWLVAQKSVWDDKGRINLVLIAKSVMVFSYLPGQEVTLVTIPEETLIEVIHGYGQYRLESIYDLGCLEKRGGDLLTGSLQETLGLPLNGYLLAKDSQLNFEDPQKLKAFFIGKKITNLSWWDLFRLWWQVKKMRPDQFKIDSFSEVNGLKKETLADGAVVFEIESEKTDRLIADFFKDLPIRRENLAIAVLNGTSHPGLAQRVSRLITNIGGRVVKIGDWESSVATCQIWVEAKQKTSYTLRKLKNVYQCQLISGPASEQRADLVLLIGEDYWKKLTEKW